MPAPVPPGYTRGPIVWLAPAVETSVAARQMQWLWREAGGYGARLVLMTVEEAYASAVAGLYGQMATWESDELTQVVALDRGMARDAQHVGPIERATGIVLVGDDPHLWAANVGGTPLAQAIRRANARGKLVAGVGAVGAFLCQHIISPGSDVTTLHGAVTFGPGLGLVNRLVVDSYEVGAAMGDDQRWRLVAAVVANPYLVGVGMGAGCTAMLHSDNTLYASGPNALTLVDGQAVEAAVWDMPLNAAATYQALCTARNGGAHHITLEAGDAFNLDDHAVRPAGEVDLPFAGPVTSTY